MASSTGVDPKMEIQIAQSATVQLPTIIELRDDATLAVRGKENDLNVLLNERPPDAWIYNHPLAKVKNAEGKEVPSRYLTIARQEWLMTRIFVKWYNEVLDVHLIANSVAVVLRVHYLNPVTGDWQHTDGVGAVPLQTDKDAGATDFSRIKSGAVQMALPSAKSYAFKDAVETIGNLFGKDLNRRDLLDYRSLLNQFPVEIDAEQVAELLKLSGQDRKILETVAEFFGVATIEEVPQSKFNQAKARVLDIINYRNGTDSSHS